MTWTASYYGTRPTVAAQARADTRLPQPLKPVIEAMLAARGGVAEATDVVQLFTTGTAFQQPGTGVLVFRDLRLSLICGDQSKQRAALKAWAK